MPNQNTRVTLKTIAEQCDYSVNTVSRALRNDPKLPPQTISKIQASAAALGYIRNSHASSLRSGRSNMIAIIVDDILNLHYSMLISEIDSLLCQEGYEFMILCTHHQEELVSQMIQLAISNSVDGILFFPFLNSSAPIKMIAAHNIPFVLIDRKVPGISADVVCCDDFTGGYMAGRELCRLGHRKFLYASGPAVNGSQIQRESGFRQALSDHNIPKENLRTVSTLDIMYAASQRARMELLSPVEYTAVFSFNDQTAYTILNCFLTENYRVPEDVSIIGFDYIRQAFPYLPSLTSVACKSVHDMANAAVRLLLQRIQNPSCPYQHEVLPVSIFHDGTTSSPTTENKQ